MDPLFNAAASAVSTAEQAERRAIDTKKVVLMQAVKVLRARGQSLRNTAKILNSSKVTVERLQILPSTSITLPGTDFPDDHPVIVTGWGSRQRLDEVSEWCLIYDGEHGIPLPKSVLNLTKSQALKTFRDACEKDRVAGESRLTDDERTTIYRRRRLAGAIARAHGASEDDLQAISDTP